MQILKSISALRSTLAAARKKNKTIGFVPTMGAFHEGHLSLMRACRKQNDIVVVSIFVNPTQFGAGEDFTSYPRDKKNDCLLAKKENLDIIFYPSEKSIYPDRTLTYIDVDKIAGTLCGASRPGHFRGVATVVGKLLNIVAPDTLYLGQKDAQQCAVIQQMVRDLNFPVKVKILPTKREPDGLAISSRNKYLSAQQRREAPVLYQSLCLAKKAIRNRQKSSTKINLLIQKTISKKSSGKVDYIACVDANTLQPLKTIKGKTLITLAVRFGRTRLIDNIIVTDV
ncbi:MAG: pantoate--beta-alanine ligase [Candidatus Omnitrophica bacterium]|nr:pantoate--beta-alanine ligase [Candidatus Omnitrophota bacterium]